MDNIKRTVRIQAPAFGNVKCDNCSGTFPLVFAYRVIDERDVTSVPALCCCLDCAEEVKATLDRRYADAERDRQAWDEDEADMQRIAHEWEEYDRDPPGS